MHKSLPSYFMVKLGQFITCPTHRNKQLYTHKTGGQFGVANKPELQVFELREDARVH